MKTKIPNNHESQKRPTIPEYVPVDMLTTPSPGIVTQMTGTLMKARYKYVTVFVDQYSRYTYVYPQTTQTSEETLKPNKLSNWMRKHIESRLDITTQTMECLEHTSGSMHAIGGSS